MNAILHFLIKRPKVVHLFLFFVLAIGMINLLSMNRTGYPNVDFGMITVTTIYPGASAEDIELKITSKIEDELSGLTDVKRMVSSSIENMSQISIHMEESADYEKAESDAEKLVAKADLPADLLNDPVVEKIDNERIPVLEIAVSSPSDDYDTLYHAVKKIEDRLLQIPEVSGVSKKGFLEKEIHILADTQALKEYQLSTLDLINAVEQNNQRQPGGDLKSATEKKLILRSDYQTLEDIENTVIRSGFHNNKVLLSDVATVIDTTEPKTRIISYNGKHCVQLAILKKAEEDMLNTVDAVKAALVELKPYYKELDIELITDYSVEVKSLLDLVKLNGIYGIIFVLAFLVVLLEFNVAFWTAAGIPISILIAFLFLPSLDVSFNFISLMGIILVLGMVVDDAIVVSENISKHKENGDDPETAAIKGTQEVIKPVIATVATTILAFAPLMFMTGVMGKFMIEMPIVVSLVLLGSLAECLLVLPVHIAHSKISKGMNFRKRLISYLENKYLSVLRVTSRYKYVTIVTFIAIFISSIYVLNNKMQFVLFHNPDGLYGTIEFETETGTSLEETESKSKALERILNTYPKNEINGYVTIIGEEKAEMSTFGTNVKHSAVGNILVFLGQFKERERNATQIMDEIAEKFSKVDGFKSIKATPLSDGPPVGKAITVTLVGNDTKQREASRDQILAFLNKQAGVKGIETSEGTGKSRVEIHVDQDKASQLGISIPAIFKTIQTHYNGSVVSDVNWENDEINIRVTVPDSEKKSLSEISELFIQNKRGKYVPISHLIELEEKEDILSISHYDKQRSVAIYADVDQDLTNSHLENKKIKDFTQSFSETFPFISVVFGGEERDSQEAMQSLGIAMILALLGIYAVLVILFNSFSQPFVIMSSIPFTMPGVIFAFYLHGIVFGFMAIIGIIGLTGVVVNNALIMISFINRHVERDGFSLETVTNAAAHRLRPVLLTTISTTLGLIPAAYSFGGDNTFIIPMMMAFVWGLIFASVVTLFLTPALYLMHYRFRHRQKP